MEQPGVMILCIDDDGLALEARKELLENNGYQVLTSCSGKDGLRLFLSNLIDAVMVDFEMPEMPGDRVAREMKRMKPHIPILMLSGHAELPENTLVDVDAFLCKGESWLTMLSALDKLLQARLSSFDRWWESWKYYSTHSELASGGSGIHH